MRAGEAPLNVIITEWALDSYLNLVASKAFSRNDYKWTIRPDVERLKLYPNEPCFANNKFWSPATSGPGVVIANGYKMKWHNLGSGQIQLRLPVAMLGDALLCEAYAKSDAKAERRYMARFKTHIALIRRGTLTVRGRLP